VPGGLTIELPRLGIQPSVGLNDLRRSVEAFDRCPLWLLDRMELNPSQIRPF
jgi:hypothetical protein